MSALIGQIPAGATYVVKEASGGTTGAPLTASDATDDTNMSGTNGKVALVSSQTALTCGADCDTAAGVVDFVGYGTANDFEGTAAPAPSNAASVSRDSTGTDTDNTGANFALSNPPTPTACGHRLRGAVDHGDDRRDPRAGPSLPEGRHPRFRGHRRHHRAWISRLLHAGPARHRGPRRYGRGQLRHLRLHLQRSRG